MEQLLDTIYHILTEATPIGVVALALIILLSQRRQEASLTNLKENHLHEVKEAIERLEMTVKESQAVQTNLLNDIKTGIEVIKIKINGKK